MCSFFFTSKFLLWLFPTLDFRKTNSLKRFEQPCGRHVLEMSWVMRLLCFSGCVNTSFSISMLHYSHMMKSSCTQPPNCVVCSVSLLSKLQKLQMISLIDYELEIHPPTQLLVFQDTDSVSLLTLSKNTSWNTSDVQLRKIYSVNERVPWHSFKCYGKYISEYHIRFGLNAGVISVFL